MSSSNANVADILRRYAAALSLEGADRFKLKAYRRAAETIEELDDHVSDMVHRGADLTALPGIGKSISGIIGEIVRSGTLAGLERAVGRLTPERAELATRPALDPKTVLRVYKRLGIGSLAELKAALDEGRIEQLLGRRVSYHVHQGLDERPRTLLYSLQEVVRAIERYLRSAPSL